MSFGRGIPASTRVFLTLSSCDFPAVKPKLAEESIAELKASIAKARDGANTHKYVKAAKGERRWAHWASIGSIAPHTLCALSTALLGC